MQDRLSSRELELLVWLDLVIRGDERVKQTEIYRAQQERLERLDSEADIEAEVAELARRSRHLERILHPSHEPDRDLRAARAPDPHAASSPAKRAQLLSEYRTEAEAEHAVRPAGERALRDRLRVSALGYETVGRDALLTIAGTRPRSRVTPRPCYRHRPDQHPVNGYPSRR